MRGDELLDVLEYIDPALIERAERRPKKIWLRWTAVAACLAVVIGVCAYFFPTPGQDPTTGTPTPMISLTDHTVCPERLTGVQVLGSPVSGSSQSNSGTQGEPPSFMFCTNIVVEARVVEILPEVYVDALTNYQYHILRLETLDVVNGKNVPQEFYLRLYAWLSPALDQFDSLILSIEQVGIENYLMVNSTTRTMEAFSLLFQVYNYYRPHYGSVIAFSDGRLDVSLWELERWGIGEYYLQKILEGDSWMHFPASEGSTPENAKENILKWVENNEIVKNRKVETQADFPEHTVFDYVEPFANGVFAHRYYGTAVRYIRLINGFCTTERILLKNGEVIPEGEAFTKEELSAVPDLGSMIENLNLDALEQPHEEYYEGRDVRLWQQGATGMYAKVDGQLYGIVKVTWHYLQNGFYDGELSYYDALYYLVSADGSYRTASYEELTTLIGDNEFLVKPTTPEELDIFG